MGKAHRFTRRADAPATERPARPQLQLFGGPRPRRPRWSAQLLDMVGRAFADLRRARRLDAVLRHPDTLGRWLDCHRQWRAAQHMDALKRHRTRPRLTRAIARDIWAAASWVTRCEDTSLARRERMQLMDWAQRLLAWAQWSE